MIRSWAKETYEMYFGELVDLPDGIPPEVFTWFHTGGNNELAGTDPGDADSNLRILALDVIPGEPKVNVRWSTVLNRCYYLLASEDLVAPGWADTGLGLLPPDGLTTERNVEDAALPQRYFCVQAVHPLSP